MESDINYPKSRAFNAFLRFLQLALSLACAAFVLELVERACVDGQYRMVEGAIGAVVVVSLIALTIIKCSTRHPKVAFFLLFLLEVAAVVAVAFFAFQNLRNNNCAFAEEVYLYSLGQIALYVLVILLVLTFPLLWIQRFTNSPGNLVWPGLFLFFVKQWPGNFNTLLLLIAALTVLISGLTFIANIFAGFKGTTTGIKKFIKFSWILDLLLMLANEGLAIYAFTLGRSNGHFQDGFNGSKVKILLQCFILINLVDIIFWLYGYQSLDYENGDSIRDELVRFGKNPDFQQASEVQEYERGGQLGQLQ